MKFTKKEDLSFFLMSKLALNYKKRLTSLSELAIEFNISEFFLKQLVRPLIKADLLISKEGKGGGYSLSKNPSKITVFDIFSALSTLPNLTQCCTLNTNEKCHLSSSCKPKFIWQKVNNNLLKEIKKIKLSDLI